MASRRAGWIVFAGRLILGGVWIAAGVLKFPDPAGAERAVRAYQLLPEVVVGPVAFGLPALEVALGVLLVLGAFVRGAAIGSAVLLVLFLTGIGSAWGRGLQIDCGCFGGGGEVAAGDTAYLTEALRDTALLLLSLALIRWPRSWLAMIDRRQPDDRTSAGRLLDVPSR